jgi:hypothetical protein
MGSQENAAEATRLLVEKKLNTPLRQAEWDELVREHWLEDALQTFYGDQKAQIDYLAGTVRKLRASGYFAFGRSPGRRRASTTDRFLELSSDESLMAATVSEAMAARARALPAVKDVHNTILMRADTAEQFWSEEDSPLYPELIQHVVSLAVRFGWDPENAALFAFSDTIPLVEPLRASISAIDFPDEYDPSQIRSRCRLLLDADPWISEATLLKAFRELRKESIGSDQRLPTPQQLEVFRFVLTRLDDRGQPIRDSANRRGSWQGIGRQWNELHEDDGWSYSRPDHIKEVFDTVSKKLVARRFVLSGEDELSLEARASGREHGKRYTSFVDPRHRTPGDCRSTKSRQGVVPLAMAADTPTDTPTPMNASERT